MNKRLCFLFFIIFSNLILAQNSIETQPPYYIKTISFVTNNKNVMPIFRLGESFEFNFDDLQGNEADYYFEIIQFLQVNLLHQIQQ